VQRIGGPKTLSRTKKLFREISEDLIPRNKAHRSISLRSVGARVTFLVDSEAIRLWNSISNWTDDRSRKSISRVIARDDVLAQYGNANPGKP
jgi:hypothetical protein